MKGLWVVNPNPVRIQVMALSPSWPMEMPDKQNGTLYYFITHRGYLASIEMLHAQKKHLGKNLAVVCKDLHLYKKGLDERVRANADEAACLYCISSVQQSLFCHTDTSQREERSVFSFSCVKKKAKSRQNEV